MYSFQSIYDSWSSYMDSDDIAERLIKRHDWSFAEAREFAEKDLRYGAEKYETKLAKQWIADNGYTLPFPVGSRVQWRNHEGVILEDAKNYHLPCGKVCVLTDDDAERNLQNEAEGVAFRFGGYVCKREDLILVGEGENDMD